MTLEQLQAQRAQIVKEIQRRRAQGLDPKGFEAQLASIDTQIRTLRNSPAAPTTTPTQGGGVAGAGPGAVTTTPSRDTPATTDTSGDQRQRIQDRIDYLRKIRPNDPEIAELQKKLANLPAAPAPGGAAPGGGTTPPGTPPASMPSLEAFLGGIFGNFQDLDLSGAPKILTSDDLASSRQSAYDSLYRQQTENLDRDRARDLEAQKQELAERGIPYDPANADSLYGKTVGAVDEKYRAYQRQAEDAANLGADQRLATLAGVNATARDAFVDSATRQFQSQIDAASAGGNILAILTQKYGIDQQTAQAILDREQQKWIAKQDFRLKNKALNKPSGGGSSGGGGGSQEPAIGSGYAPGFGV